MGEKLVDYKHVTGILSGNYDTELRFKKSASVTIGILQIGDLIDEYEDDEDGDYEEERHDIKKFESIQRELKKKEKQRIAKISRDLDVLEKDLGRDSIE